MNNQGASLVATIFILVILSLLGAALCTLIVLDARTGATDLCSMQAFNLADSGIEHGLWKLHGDLDHTWTPDPSIEHSLANGTFTLALNNNKDGTETLYSSGYVPNRASAIAKRVVEISGDLVPAPRHKFYEQALWFDGALAFDYSRFQFTTSGKPRADMYAGGDITFQSGNGQTIAGTVRSAGIVTKDSWTGDDPWGTVEQEVERIPCPPLHNNAKEWYKEHAFSVLPSQTISSDLNLEAGELYYIEGTITIAEDIKISGNGALVATGDITILGEVAYKKKGSGPLALVSFGDIHCNQATDPLDASLYADGQIVVSTPNVTIKVFGNLGSRQGFAVADNTNIQVNYDKRLSNWTVAEKSLPTAPSRIYTWREVYK